MAVTTEVETKLYGSAVMIRGTLIPKSIVLAPGLQTTSTISFVVRKVISWSLTDIFESSQFTVKFIVFATSTAIYALKE